MCSDRPFWQPLGRRSYCFTGLLAALLLCTAFPEAHAQSISMCGSVAVRSSAANVTFGASINITTNDGATYLPNANCSLALSLVGTPDGWVLRLRFLAIHTQSIYDELSVFDGANESGALLWRDAGLYPQPPVSASEVNTTGPIAFLRFTSNAATQYAGITMQVEAVPPLPPDLLVMCPLNRGASKNSTAVVTPSSPLTIATNLLPSYPSQALCSLVVTLAGAPPGWVLRVRFLAIGTFYDEFSVYDGLNSTAPLLWREGSDTATVWLHASEVNTTQTTAFLQLISDGNVSTGFLMVAEAVPPLPPDLVVMCAPSRRLSKWSAAVVTPSAPLLVVSNLLPYYPEFVNCSLQLTLEGAPPGWVIRLRFLMVRWRYQPAAVYDGPNTSAPLLWYEYSPELPEPPVAGSEANTTQGAAFIQLTNNWYGNYTGEGLQFIAEAVPPPSRDIIAICPLNRRLAKSSAAVVTPTAPLLVTTNLLPKHPYAANCSLSLTLAEAPADWVVRLRFVAVKLWWDPFSVYDGADETAPLIWRDTRPYNSTPAAIAEVNTTQGSAYLRLESHIYNQGDGMQIIAEAVPPLPADVVQMCWPSIGLAKDGAAVVTPAMPLTVITNTLPIYATGVNCSLALTLAGAPSGWVIRLRFMAIKVTDAFSVFDGVDDSAPLVWRDKYVYASPPAYSSEANTTQGSAFLLFTVSATGTKNAGIQLIAEAVPPLPVDLIPMCHPCGGLMKSSAAVVTPAAPLTIVTNLLATYAPLVNCSLALTLVGAPAGYVIRLRFAAFKTQSNYDPLVVFDGDSDAFPVLWQGSGGFVVNTQEASASQGSAFITFGTSAYTHYSGVTIIAEAATTPSVTPSPSSTPSPSVSRSVSPSTSASRSVAAFTTGTRSVTPSRSISPSISASRSVSGSVSPSVSMTASLSGSASLSASVSATPTQSSSNTLSPSLSPSGTTSISASASTTASSFATVSETASASASASATGSSSVSPSQSPLPSVEASVTPSQSEAPSISASPASSSWTPSPSLSQSTLASVSPTPSASATAEATPSVTATISTSPSKAASLSPSPSASTIRSASGSWLPSLSASPSATPSAAPSVSASASMSASETRAQSSVISSPAASATATATMTGSDDSSDPSLAASGGGAVQHSLTLISRWHVATDGHRVTVRNISRAGGAAIFCPLRRWYTASVAQALLRPPVGSSLRSAGIRAATAMLVSIAAADGTDEIAEPATAANAPLAEACPLPSSAPLRQLGARSSPGVLVRRLQAEAEAIACARAAASTAANVSSLITGLDLLFSIAVNSSRLLDAAAVLAALQAQMAVASASTELQSLLAALRSSLAISGATASSQLATVASSAASTVPAVDAGYVDVSVCSRSSTGGSNITTTEAQPSVGAVATRSTAPAGAVDDSAGIAIGIGAGLGAAALLAVVATALWLRRHSAGSLSGLPAKLKPKAALDLAGKSLGAPQPSTKLPPHLLSRGGSIRMLSNPLDGKSGPPRPQVPAGASAPAPGSLRVPSSHVTAGPAGLRVPSSQSLAMYAGKGALLAVRRTPLRSLSSSSSSTHGGSSRGVVGGAAAAAVGSSVAPRSLSGSSEGAAPRPPSSLRTASASVASLRSSSMSGRDLSGLSPALAAPAGAVPALRSASLRHTPPSRHSHRAGSGRPRPGDDDAGGGGAANPIAHTRGSDQPPPPRQRAASLAAGGSASVSARQRSKLAPGEAGSARRINFTFRSRFAPRHSLAGPQASSPAAASRMPGSGSGSDRDLAGNGSGSDGDHDDDEDGNVQMASPLAVASAAASDLLSASASAAAAAAAAAVLSPEHVVVNAHALLAQLGARSGTLSARALPVMPAATAVSSRALPVESSAASVMSPASDHGPSSSGGILRRSTAGRSALASASRRIAAAEYEPVATSSLAATPR